MELQVILAHSFKIVRKDHRNFMQHEVSVKWDSKDRYTYPKLVVMYFNFIKKNIMYVCSFSLITNSSYLFKMKLKYFSMAPTNYV